MLRGYRFNARCVLAHIAQAVTALLRAHFRDDRMISRIFPTTYPLHLPDLNPCDFWLWGFLKVRVHRGNIWTLFNFKASIIHDAVAIYRGTFCDIVEHPIICLAYVFDANGTHIH